MIDKSLIIYYIALQLRLIFFNNKKTKEVTAMCDFISYIEAGGKILFITPKDIE